MNPMSSRPERKLDACVLRLSFSLEPPVFYIASERFFFLKIADYFSFLERNGGIFVSLWNYFISLGI
jgi:hypothetical protein